MKSLNQFYEVIAQDAALKNEFESIIKKDNFIDLIIDLGAKQGYTFTAADVAASIEENTASGQGQFFCLPMGCWHKEGLA